MSHVNKEQRYFNDKNNENKTSEEDNYVEIKYIIKCKIIMVKLFSITTDGTPAMSESKASWLIIINKNTEEK